MTIKTLFSDWTCESLEEIFGLRRVYEQTMLDSWLRAGESVELTEFEHDLLVNLQAILLRNVDAWNEAELTEFFIGPVLTFVNFHTDEFNLFSERALSGIVGDYELSGIPDAVIATGHFSPKIPYFCLREYKKENEPKGDPAAQALAAMLVAQEMNHRPHPIYGMYIVGKMWYFLMLSGKAYCMTVGHNALKEEIFDIFKILKALKAILIEIARQDA